MTKPTSTPGEKAKRETTIRVELNVRTALIAIGAIAAVWLFLQLWTVLLVIVIALMIVGTLSPFVTSLEHRGMRRNYAIAIVFVGLFISIAAIGLLTVPRFVGQLTDILDGLPRRQAAIAAQLDTFKLGAPLAKSVRETSTSDMIANLERAGIAYSSKVMETTAYAMTSLFLALYIIVDRDRIRGAAFSLVPRDYHVRASRVLLNLETIVGGYMRGQAITSAMMAVFTFIVLSVARVPNALTLSLFAGIVDVLPYVGALLVCGPAFLVALSRGTTVALVVLISLALYQEIESRFIVPRVYGKVLRLPAAAVLVAFLIGGQLLGILGALLALPIAAGLRMVVAELRLELPGEASDDAELRQLDKQEEETFERRAAGAPAVEAAAIATEIAEARLEHDAAEGGDASDVPLTSSSSK